MTSRDHWRLTPGLIAQGTACLLLLVACGALIADEKASETLIVIAQVGLAVVGAWFGSLIPKATVSADLVSKARSSVRQLVDHAAVLGGISATLASWQERLSGNDRRPDTRVVQQWMLDMDDQVRAAIRDTETAVDNWDDIAPGVAKAQIREYQNRHGRLTGAVVPPAVESEEGLK